ncbi:bifunctional phosphoribosylaminoimidazole carboxylase/phosphoribosylaminoimidazole succinocarboxamide synthetase isoform X1 [Danio rerio]|uniref:Bifunctional phosphoribosylaminoimidazole carboxylase/phosphoribosylaminoimidazole succinocarboxamide synthetase isoform X1 n=3 Tax=Danio rerio TaxID=7955 RepID=A0AB32TF25_DANRE
MEPETDPQRHAGEDKRQRDTAGHWRGEEVKTLLTVWRERLAWEEEESRAKYEAISSRLRELGVCKDWLECKAQSRRMALPDWRPPQGIYKRSAADSRTPIQRPYMTEEEPTTGRREEATAVPGLQEGLEGGRHWSDKEVRALLTVWGDKEVHKQLQRSHRNKAIFQEMAHRLERQHGVVRDWRQCRTKYKNMKYDYKVSKSQGRPIRFFAELDAIMQGKEFEGRFEDDESPRNIPNRDHLAMRREPMEEQVIKIDDDESLAEMQTMMNAATHPLIPRDSTSTSASATEMNVITVHDSGRNWSEDEVAALLQIWAEEGIQRQLQGSTRNKDIFVQISRRLLQQGVERDWKQCRTKYKNLKYLYRSLQRGKADIGDPRRVMRFYEQLDTLLSKPTRSRMSYAEFSETNRLRRSSRMITPPSFEEPSMGGLPQENNDIDAVRFDQPPMDEAPLGSPATSARVFQSQAEIQTFLTRSEEASNVEFEIPVVNSTIMRTTGSPQIEYEQHLSSDSISAVIYDDSNKYRRISDNGDPSYTRGEHEPARKGKKRKAADEGDRLLCKQFHQSTDDGESSTDWSENIDFQCKEEDDQYFPIMEITSVCSMASNAITSEQSEKQIPARMSTATELKLGQKLNEGKTKQIFEILDEPGHVLVQSKDQITAGNAVRKDQMEGKAAIANKTTSCVFKLLQDAGLKTAFVRQHSDTAFVASRCEMIPIEWVCRRIATGSFLKRNPGVKEGYRFTPLKMEMFFKDDANNDPQWSEEQLLAAGFDLAGLTIGRCEVDIMSKSTVAIFEVLEKAWATQDCTLVDMKIEFGVNVTTKEIVLADVIDNDSWRLWPAGDRSQQKDKQVYRDLKEVTPEAMQMVKRNFEWVAERVKLLLESQARGRVVVMMGSTSDVAHCEKIRKACASYGIPCHLRVNSAHKGPDETLRIKAEYEGDGEPTIFVAVAGRSNGLGPVMSGNTAYPVINCPPVTPDWGAQDIWSSLRMPSGLGCSTVLSPEAAAQFAAQILGLNNHLIWAKLRASMLNTWVSLKQADKKMQDCSL